MKKLLLLLCMISLPCFAITKKKLKVLMDSWLGNSQNELVLAWGPPTRTGDDGKGGSMLIYAYERYIPSVYAYNHWTRPETWYDYRIFYVNWEKKIYAWRTSSQQVPPQQIDLHIYYY